MRHDGSEKDWDALGAQALVPSVITYEPKINSRTVQGERTRAGVRQDGGTAEGGAVIIGESQGGREPTVNGADVLTRRLGQVQ